MPTAAPPRGPASTKAATERAQTARDALINAGEPITVRGLAMASGVSIDFLYRSPLRGRVERLRAEQQRTAPVPIHAESEVTSPLQSNVVRALTGQIAELKRRHRAETEQLQAALAAAQGESLELRRQLGGGQARTAAA